MDYKVQITSNGNTEITLTVGDAIRTYVAEGDAKVIEYDPESARHLPTRAVMIRPVRPLSSSPDAVVMLIGPGDNWHGTVDSGLLRRVTSHLRIPDAELVPFLLDKFTKLARTAYGAEEQPDKYLAAFGSEIERNTNSFEVIRALPADAAPEGYPIVFDDIPF